MKLKSAVILSVLAASLIGCGEETIPTSKIDANRLGKELRGYKVPSGVAMRLNDDPVWVKQIVSGFSDSASRELPQDVSLLPYHTGCSFTKPTADEQVVYVHIVTSPRRTKIFTARQSDVISKSNQYVESIKSGNVSADYFFNAGGSVDLRDVFVTQTNKPVYLVLISSAGGIWNIHAADGVKISRIAMIGRRSLGVVHADAATPVEAMSGGLLQHCGVVPARRPQPHWRFIENMQASGIGSDLLDKHNKRFWKFFGFLEKNFGETEPGNILAVNQAGHVLIGDVPAPEARMAYRSMDGASVHVTEEDHIFVTDKQSAKKEFKKLVVDLATEMAGGDLSTLEPGS